jgi:beta-phosphoglucomutase
MPQYNGYAVLWDVDGTLVDTAEMHYNAWAQLAQDINKPFTRQMFGDTFGWRNPEIIAKLFGNYTPEEVAQFGFNKEEYYRAEARKGVELLPGVRRLLADLHAAGFKQAVGSSAPRQNVDLIMAVTNAGQYFESIVSMEDTTRGKPDPQVFLVGAEKLGIPPERCLVMEDATAGVKAAKAGGMKCIAVRFIPHHSEESLREAGADLIVPNMEQVTVETVLKLLQSQPVQ